MWFNGGFSRAWWGATHVQNYSLEAYFYDLTKLHFSEVLSPRPEHHRGGTLAVVQPTHGVAIYRDLNEYVDSGRVDTRTLAIGGVGCSILGTMAFARSLANTLNEPVLGYVTGYGAGDLVEDWIDAKGEANIPESLGKRVAAGLSLVRDSDKAPLVSLLSDPRLCLSRAVVHSRGSLLLSQSLRSGIESQLTEVLSLGLVTYFPSRFCCTQYLGTLDMVGQAMSKTKLPHRTLENCGHHLNPWVAGAIPLEAILTELAWANSSA